MRIGICCIFVFGFLSLCAVYFAYKSAKKLKTEISAYFYKVRYEYFCASSEGFSPQ